MQFVLVDSSTAATDAAVGGPITTAQMQAMAAAFAVQLNRDLAAEWGGNYSVRAGTEADIAPGEIVCNIVDTLPDAPGDIAYHSDDGSSHPLVLLAKGTCNGILSGSESVSAAMSHELCETAVDRACNVWADDGHGSEWAQEACDATESNSYTITTGAGLAVTVSNFLLRSFFAPGAPAPWSYLGSLGSEPIPGPFTCASGGYQMKRAAPGTETQVNGTMRASRAAKAKHWSSRVYVRGARVG
jgi:hypothetical protein